MGFSLANIGKALKKIQGSDNQLLKGVRNFGQGMAQADGGIGEQLAAGGAGVAGGMLNDKFNPTDEQKRKKRLGLLNDAPMSPTSAAINGMYDA